MEILADRIADTFVCRLVWERLGYKPNGNDNNLWEAGPTTPLYWSEKFIQAPEIITTRSASIHLTRSIPKEYKQALKDVLHFKGYVIGELYPRRTRRATAVNWLLAWALSQDVSLPSCGEVPSLFDPPSNPLNGHPGDPIVN